MPTRVHIGSVSTGTLRAEDLIPAFADVLSEIAPAEYHKLAQSYATGNDEEYCSEEDESDMVDELEQSLSDRAPDFCYFGAHPGDGADFGFWICWDSIENAAHDGSLVKVDAGDEWPALASDVDYVLEVNDHGNSTLYTRERREVWSVV